jgi:hypothetical protein
MKKACALAGLAPMPETFKEGPKQATPTPSVSQSFETRRIRNTRKLDPACADR